MDKTVYEMIKELKDSPLYAMSLGGRELYHSNFWAWLIEYGEKNKNKGEGNPFLKIFLGEYYNEEYYAKTPDIDREKEHRDLTITFDKDVFVIENKLKSIATLEQLERYENSVEFELDKDGNIKTYRSKKNNGQKKETGRNFKCGVLTGISKDINLPDKWHFLPYGQICEGLSKICKKMNRCDDNCFKEILEKYIKDTEQISLIITKVVPQEIDTWNMDKIDSFNNDNDWPKLSDIRMDDLCKKKWANEFAKMLREQLNLDNSVKEYKLKIASGFTNKQPLVEVFYRKGKDDLIGIQIQGAQYRRCFSKSGDKATSLGDRFVELKKANWFSDYTYKNNKENIIEFKYSEKSESYSTNQRKENYCSYKPSFIYQYRNLNGKNYYFKEILNSINKDMEFAKQVLNELNL